MFSNGLLIDTKGMIEAINSETEYEVVDVTGGRGYAVHGLEYPEKFDCTDTDPGSGLYRYFLMDRGKHSMYTEKPDKLNAMGEFFDEEAETRGEQHIVVEEYDDYDATECSW